MSLGRVLEKSNFFNLHSKKKRRYGNKFLDPRMLVMVIWLWFLYYMYMVFSVHKTVWCIFIHVHKVFYIISSVREKLRSQNHIIFLKIPLSLSRVMIIVSDSFIGFNTMRHIKIIYGNLPLDLIYWHILVYFQWVGLSKDSISEPQQNIKIYLTSLSLIIHCQVFAKINQCPRDKGLFNNIVTNVALFIVTKLYFITFIF